MARRILVLTTDAGDMDSVREQVGQAAAGEEIEVRVVVPATKLSPLQWLANDEDEARRKAADEAEATAAALPGEAETEVGDSDPVQAIEDALRTYPADELVIATRAGAAADWLEGGSGEEALRRFDLPVRRVVLGDD
jgi:nucleotide-binding universal stress UspA family protein